MKHTFCSVLIKATPIAGPAFTQDTPCVFVCVGCHRYTLLYELQIRFQNDRTVVCVLSSLVCEFVATLSIDGSGVIIFQHSIVVVFVYLWLQGVLIFVGDIH